ncbi:type IV toxin-antitoxin system AbiEi family antitoxin domain-containing protein [Luteococcus sp.]|uniref:type IV toxin-antitoxin system AbiEi family antitoxin domain-containing protein n=1 Tax=Luteococcus sp. TaxID=1969402 RepID=UPI0037360458
MNFDPLRESLDLARHQAGVLTRQQALGCGLPRKQLLRLVDQGQWRRLAPGIYLTHHAQADLRALGWGGVLLGGEGSQVAGRAALALAGVAGEPPVVEILLPEHVRRANQQVWQFRRTLHLPRPRGNPPRSPIEEAVLDACAAEPVAAEELVTAASRAGMSRRALRRALGRRTRFPQRIVLEDLLAESQEGLESPLEVRYLRDVERAHQLPAGIRQVDGEGQRRDVVYELGLVVELDGRLGHEGTGAFRDMAKDNAAALRGLHHLRFGWTDCAHRPCATARQVTEVLWRLGWQGSPSRCRRCS